MIARLADRGEQTLARLAELPGGAKALSAMNDLRTRVDELGKKVRGIDELEQRVAKLEKELAAREASPEAEAADGGVAGRPASARRRRRNAQLQRARQHLEPRRRRARLLAVELDRHRLVGLDRDDPPPERLRLRVGQMGAAVDLRHRQHEVALRDVADRDDVEEAVAGSASGHIFMPPPKKRPFATTTSNIGPLRVSPSTVRRVSTADQPGEDGEGGPEVRRLRAEGLRGVVGALRDRAAHARARDVGEERRAVAAVPAPVADAAEVDRLGVAA